MVKSYLRGHEIEYDGCLDVMEVMEVLRSVNR